MSVISHNRRPAGSPHATGGQFAGTTRDESGLVLEPAVPVEAARPGGREVTAGRFAPSVLDPARVEWIDTIDLRPEADLDGSPLGPAVDWDAYGDDWAVEAENRGRSTCTMCGQTLRYVNVMRHAEHGIFTVGTDCADSVGIAADLGTKVSELRANRQARTENRKREAQYDRFLADDPEFAAALAYADRDRGDFDPFIADVADSARRRGTPTEGQRDAVVRAAHRNRERAVERAVEDAMEKIPVPEGRQEISGKVLSVRDEPNPFSYYDDSVLKMLVRDDRGFKVWMTAPRALTGSEGGLRGKRVTFTATLQKSDNDQHFGFGKRPARAGFLPPHPGDEAPGSDDPDETSAG